MRIELQPADLEPLVEQVILKAMTKFGKQAAASLSETPRLALRRKEAAEALSISVSTLDVLTKAGRVPHVRPNGNDGAPVYPVDLLQSWLRETAAATTESIKPEEKS